MYKVLILSVSLLSIVLLSCDQKVDRPAPVLSQEQISQQQSKVDAPTIPSGGAVASSVQHYYCPNNCAGSGGDNAGSCPVCGTEYVHNQAYHNQPNNAITTNQTTVEEPPQNAAGVWHYTCPQGCDGGAGSAIACSQCGSTLAHNAAYHN